MAFSNIKFQNRFIFFYFNRVKQKKKKMAFDEPNFFIKSFLTLKRTFFI